MAQFRTTADYVDAVLNRAGETTSGTSPYESDALTYLNKIHYGLLAGGLIFDVNVDEAWTWARAKYPYVIELKAPITTGTITLTNGTDAGTFSSAPAVSLTGWHIRASGEKTVYRIAAHTASSTAFEIDSFYVGTTGASKNYEAFKLDYEIVPTHVYIESGINDKLDFIRTGSTEATATLTAGAYTPSALGTHVAAQITTAAGGSSTYGCTYDSVTGKFTLTSTLTGGDIFKFLGATGTNVARSAWGTLGFDYSDNTSAASQVATYVLGGVTRLVGPMRAFRAGLHSRDIEGVEIRTLQEDCPLSEVAQRIPRKFAVLREGQDGRLVVRFDGYPSEAMKVEVDVIEVPLDLKDLAASVPKVPRKYSDILEYGAACFILTDKEDDKAATYMQFAKAQLLLMQAAHRAQLKRTDPNFGGITPRSDLASVKRRLRYGYDSESE